MHGQNLNVFDQNKEFITRNLKFIADRFKLIVKI